MRGRRHTRPLPPVVGSILFRPDHEGTAIAGKLCTVTSLFLFLPDYEGTVERRVLDCGFWVNGVTKALRDEVLQNEAQLNCSRKLAELMCL